MRQFGRATVIGVGVVLGLAAPVLAGPSELDSSFGADGIATVPLHESDGFTFQLSDVAVGADGSTVLLGGIVGSSADLADLQFDLAVARFTAAGELDESFGATGVARVDVGEFDLPGRAALDGQGRVVFSGNQATSDSLSGFVGRLTTSGDLDPTFGTDGLAHLTDASLTFANGLAVDDADRPAVALTSADDAADTTGSATVVRLTADGQPDPAFGSDGTASITDANATAFGLVQTAAGDYAVSGVVTPDGPFTAKLDDTGAPVTSFGDGGFAQLPVAGGVATTVREIGDDGIVIGGSVGSRSGLLARLDANGQPEATFGVDGIRTVRSDDAGPMPVQGLEVGPSASVAFTGPTASGSRASVGRILASGVEDTGFGGDGYVHPLDGLGKQSSAGSALTVGSDGKLVVGGTAATDQETEAFAARFQQTAVGSPVADGSVQRVAGTDRVTTAVELSGQLFAPATEPAGRNARAAVIAAADRFPDALVAAPYAAANEAPLLLNPTQVLDDRVRAELSRLLPSGGRVTLMGGTNAIDSSVADELRAAGYQVDRIAGADRYDTSVQVAQSLAPSSVVLARGDDFADALAAGPAASEINGAVVLTAGSQLPPPVADYLDTNPGLTRYAVGGDAATAVPTAEAIVGTDRYDTAALVATRFFHTPGRTVVASGELFPDALAGGTHASLTGSPLLLSTRTFLPAPADQALARVRGFHRTVTLAGGTAVLTDDVLTAVRGAAT